MSYGFPHFSAAFETGKGTKAVAGTLDLIFNGGGRVQVSTDRGEVECKGKVYSVRCNFTRRADGALFEDSRYGHFIRNRRDFSEPTGAVRKLLTDAAREFAMTHYTDAQNAAADLAVADSNLRLACSDVEQTQKALVEATDRRDRAQVEFDDAVAATTVRVHS